MRKLRIISVAALLAVSMMAPLYGSTDLTPIVVDPETIVGKPTGPELSGDELHRRTQELASIMRCPVCQALSVADSPTASALAMKEEVRDLLAAGYDEEQVLEYFEKSYGEFILLAPKKEGLNWLVWIAPIVVLLGGGALVVTKGRGGSPGKSKEAVEPVSGDDGGLSEYAERVRQEVGE